MARLTRKDYYKYDFLLNNSNARLRLHQNLIQVLYERDKQSSSQLVGVFGAFETWPYINQICRLLASKGHVAISSRYIYAPNRQPSLLEPDKMLPMREFLWALTKSCHKAVIIFSVSAAHFVEAEWLYTRCEDEATRSDPLRVLGIAFTRQIQTLKPKAKNCRYLEIKTGYSVCGGKRNAWDCMEEKGFCPFIRQDISKNVIEYFCWCKLMTLVAVDDIEKVSATLSELPL